MIQAYKKAVGIKAGLLILGLLLVSGVLYYTFSMVNFMRNESRDYLSFYVKIYAKAATDPNFENFDFLFSEVIQNSKFPMIFEDENGNLVGKNLKQKDYPQQTLRKMTGRMDSENPPIEIPYGERILGIIHYGDSSIIQKLEWFPIFGFFAFGLFALIGFWGFHYIRTAEHRTIWVGIAKEAAHQLGTPISSLMGWTELLKTSEEKKVDSAALTWIEEDIRRLNRVAERFSKIGSQVPLSEKNLCEQIDNTIQYFQKRVERSGQNIAISFVYESSQKTIKMNADLFDWALENLIKNSIRAMDKENGEIGILVSNMPNGAVKICVKDNGKGIPKKNLKNVFRPGFSTHRRSWGLGLPLTKRIIEEYHNGKIFIESSQVGVGTTMVIVLRNATDFQG